MKPNALTRYLILMLLVSRMDAGQAQEKIFSSNTNYSLSEMEIRIFSEKAYAGDADAALRLSDKFFFESSDRKRKRLRPLALSWALIGAENGGSKSQFRSYLLLSISKKKNEQIRALFWLQQAAKNGDKDAQANLKYCKTLDSKYPSGGACFGPESDF